MAPPLRPSLLGCCSVLSCACGSASFWPGADTGTETKDIELDEEGAQRYLSLLQKTRDGMQRARGCCVLTTDLMLFWLLDAVGVVAFGSGSVSISSPLKNSLSF